MWWIIFLNHNSIIRLLNSILTLRTFLIRKILLLFEGRLGFWLTCVLEFRKLWLLVLLLSRNSWWILILQFGWVFYTWVLWLFLLNSHLLDCFREILLELLLFIVLEFHNFPILSTTYTAATPSSLKSITLEVALEELSIDLLQLRGLFINHVGLLLDIVLRKRSVVVNYYFVEDLLFFMKVIIFIDRGLFTKV